MLNHGRDQALHRSEGVTDAERYLHRLCQRSFLSLWSYPGLFRDQRTGKGGHGKEVCDLLVVFRDHIIIFSDKDCSFPNSGNVPLDWCRWLRRAVLKSAEQVWGAERWIKSFPDRLFLDRACTQRFPIELPDTSKAKIHRVVVAHAASDRCKEQFGGSGSLMLDPSVVGPIHDLDVSTARPFVIGDLDPSRGYVHVLDDTSLDIVMRELDTTADFIQYLTKKEVFFRSGRLMFAAGEEELLAFYLQQLNDQDEHDFIVPPEKTHVGLLEGLWRDFMQHPRRIAQIEANDVSYTWDRLIETFNHHILAGTSYGPKVPFSEREQAVRMLAVENRTVRRFLAKSLLQLLESSSTAKRSTRVLLPPRPGSPFYVFLLLPHLPSISD